MRGLLTSIGNNLSLITQLRIRSRQVNSVAAHCWGQEMCTSARWHVPQILVLMLLEGLSPRFLVARARTLDDDAAPKSTSLANDAAKDAKVANAGLTERERMLLDRVEQLERRVAELEAAHQPDSSSSNANSNTPVTSKTTTTSAISAGTATTAPAVAAAIAPPVTNVTANAVRSMDATIAVAHPAETTKTTKAPASAPSLLPISPGSTVTRAPRTFRSTRNSLHRKFVLTWTTFTISAIQKTTPSAAPAKCFELTKCSSRNLALAAIFITTMCALA